jgi:hypothetical protein
MSYLFKKCCFLGKTLLRACPKSLTTHRSTFSSSPTEGVQSQSWVPPTPRQLDFAGILVKDLGCGPIPSTALQCKTAMASYINELIKQKALKGNQGFVDESPSEQQVQKHKLNEHVCEYA